MYSEIHTEWSWQLNSIFSRLGSYNEPSFIALPLGFQIINIDLLPSCFTDSSQLGYTNHSHICDFTGKHWLLDLHCNQQCYAYCVLQCSCSAGKNRGRDRVKPWDLIFSKPILLFPAVCGQRNQIPRYDKDKRVFNVLMLFRTVCITVAFKSDI